MAPKISLERPSYARRFISEWWNCTWHVGKTQQLFTWAVILLITTFTGIYFKVVSGDPQTVILAILSSIGTLFLVLLIVNLFRVPARLDRCQGALISELQGRLTEEIEREAENTKRPPNIVTVAKTELVPVTIDNLRMNRYLPNQFRPVGNYQEGTQAVAITFFSKPIVGSRSFYAKAILTIKNLANDTSVIVSDAVWLNQLYVSRNRRVVPGEFVELIIGLVHEDVLYLPDADHLETLDSQRGISESCESVSGQSFEIKVELIGKDDLSRIVYAGKPVKFELVLKPTVQIREIKAPKGKGRPRVITRSW